MAIQLAPSGLVESPTPVPPQADRNAVAAASR